MTVYEAIANVKDMKHNACSDESLNAMINACEAMIQRELMLTIPDEIVQYAWPDDRDKELILPKPYDMAYVYYVKMMIEFQQGEYEDYNNTKMMFDEHYKGAQAYYNKLNPNPPALKVTNWMRW
jgi:hypothetical protein